jgi:hypothetical protein
LSPEERRRSKDQYRRQYRSLEAPTDSQIWKLREQLHYTGPIESKQQASDVIDHLLNNKN